MKRWIVLLLLYFPFLICCGTATPPDPANTSLLHGTVTTKDGKPQPGSMVRVRKVGSSIAEVIFTNAQGQYHFDDLMPGAYSVKAWTSRWQANETETELKEFSPRKFDLSLQTESQPSESAAENLASMPDNLEKRRLVQNCEMCHAIGASSTTFAGQSNANYQYWLSIMHSMVNDRGAFLTPDFDRNQEAILLSKYLLPTSSAPDLPERALIPNVAIYEYASPRSNFAPHDLCVDHTGRIWVADGANDSLEEMDAATGEWQFYDYGVKHAGAHSIIEGPDQKIWIVLQTANEIASFDPKTREFKHYPDTHPGLFGKIGPRPHTHQFDSKGKLWFTEIAADSVSMLDPDTGKMTAYKLPDQPKVYRNSFFLWPYGLTIGPGDNVFYAKLGGNRIGEIEGATRKIQEFELPVPYSGPRRMDTDAKGNLWLTAFTTGMIYRFNPETKEFKGYAIPTPNSAPYALAVDKARNKIYICEAAANKVGVFDIISDTFSEIPLPTLFGYTRKIDVDARSGMIWTVYSQPIPEENKVVGIRYR